MDDIKTLKYLVRMPNDVYRAKVDNYVKDRKRAEPGYSLNDFWLEAGRALFDGSLAAPAPRQVISQPIEKQSEPERPFWYRWELASARLEGEARDESFKEALEQRTSAGLCLPGNFWKWAPNVRLRWLRENDDHACAGMVTILGPVEDAGAAIPGADIRRLTKDELLASFPMLRPASQLPNPEPIASRSEPKESEADGW